MSVSKQKSFLVLLPEKCSDKNLLNNMVGFLNGYIPQYTSQVAATANEERIIWVDMCNVLAQDDEEGSTLFCLLGTTKGLQIWAIPSQGEALLLYSVKKGYVHLAKLLPPPATPRDPDVAPVDPFATRRPLLASVEVSSCSYQVLTFTALVGGQEVHKLVFPSDILRLECNQRHIVVARTDCITVLSATELQPKFSIEKVFIPTRGCFPLALGEQWLAFVDVKLKHWNRSAGGDCSDDSSQPLVSSVYNMQKRMWEQWSVLSNSLYDTVHQSGGPTAGSQSHKGHHQQSTKTSKSQSSEFNSGGGTAAGADMSTSSARKENPQVGGLVTVVDVGRLVQLVESYQTELQEQQETEKASLMPMEVIEGASARLIPRLRVHHDPFNKALVAHFLAHRWAQVNSLEFDSAGVLLLTSCVMGTHFNVFRISVHPFDCRQTAVHHLYVLRRGETPCSVVSSTFSWDSRWVAVTSDHGTTHLFPITPYGGDVNVRTHCQPRVVNRTSRRQKSAGMEEVMLLRPTPRKGQSVQPLSGMPNYAGAGVAPGSVLGAASGLVGMSSSAGTVGATSADYGMSSSSVLLLPQNRMYNSTNPRLPPYPAPCLVASEAQLYQNLQWSPWIHSQQAQALIESLNIGGGAGSGMSGHLNNNNPNSLTKSPHKSGTQSSTASAGPLATSWKLRSTLHAIALSARFHAPLPLLACFAETRCILPGSNTNIYHSTRAKPNHGVIESLFIVNSDGCLVEYDLNVSPKDALSSVDSGELSRVGGSVDEDGLVAVRSQVLGQWPFHQHANVADFKPLHLAPGGSPGSVNPLRMFSDSSEEVSSKSETTTVERSSASNGGEWIGEVEITTHQGPHRRLWMGPQFAFRPYQDDDTPVLAHQTTSSFSFSQYSPPFHFGDLSSMAALSSMDSSSVMASGGACLKSLSYSEVARDIQATPKARPFLEGSTEDGDNEAATILAVNKDEDLSVLEMFQGSTTGSPLPRTKSLLLPSRGRSVSSSTLPALLSGAAESGAAAGGQISEEIPAARERTQSQTSTGSRHDHSGSGSGGGRYFIEASSYQDSFLGSSMQSFSMASELLADAMTDSNREAEVPSSTTSVAPRQTASVAIPGAFGRAASRPVVTGTAGGRSRNSESHFITEEHFPPNDEDKLEDVAEASFSSRDEEEECTSSEVICVPPTTTFNVVRQRKTRKHD